VINLVAALILLLKHATSLRTLSLSPASALTHAELDYQESNIDLKIQEHLMASSQQLSVQKFAAFIMATDIGQSNFFLALLR
jgi:hypothetical protein